MNLTWALFSLSYAVCGLAPLVLVPRVLRHRSKPGSTGLLVSLGGLAIWAVGLALLVVGVDAAAPGTALLGAATAAMLGSQVAVTGYLLLAGEYTGQITITRRLLIGLAVALLVAQLPSLSDPVHGLTFGGSSQPLLDQAAMGPVGVGLILLTVAVACTALALLLLEAVTAGGVRRKQCLALSLAGGSTIVFFLLDVFLLADFLLPVFPVGFAVTGFAFAWALFRADFLDVVPVARKRIVEEMDDAAIIVDGDDRVVECNPAARRLVRAGPEYAGTPVEEFFGRTPEVVDRFEDVYGVDTEISVTADGVTRHFHLNISRIDDSGAVATDPGRLIVLRDITELKEREAELEFLQHIQARVLRHNLRNDLNVIRGHAESLATDGAGREADVGETIVRKSDELLALSRKARTIERVIDRDDATGPVDLTAALNRLVETVRASYPDASISLSAPDRCVVQADRRLESALEIVLENAVEHNDSARPTVDVDVEETDRAATVTIADDGPGIPPDELDVLERGEETPLEHGSGIGLWIVHRIVERSGATIAFDTGDDGTEVSIRIPT